MRKMIGLVENIICNRRHANGAVAHSEGHVPETWLEEREWEFGAQDLSSLSIPSPRVVPHCVGQNRSRPRSIPAPYAYKYDYLATKD